VVVCPGSAAQAATPTWLKENYCHKFHKQSLDSRSRFRYLIAYISKLGIRENKVGLRDQMRKGSTELVLLALLQQRPMYGYEIIQEMAQLGGGYFEMREGLLYPALHRLQKEGLLAAEWRETGSGRRRKYYTLTPAGEEQLKEQSSEWRVFMQKLREIINAT
jgi:PadR family transcriptional regulator, regulatory protein PadR